jgi:hypothetical protein
MAVVDTLMFVGVEPATYRVGLGDRRPEAGHYLLRFLYSGEVIHEQEIVVSESQWYHPEVAAAFLGQESSHQEVER